MADRRNPHHTHYEAVALDYLPAPPNTSKMNQDDAKDSISSKSMLILAGLTGGSDEGYIRDLVTSAHENHWHCFIMIGPFLYYDISTYICSTTTTMCRYVCCQTKEIASVF